MARCNHASTHQPMHNKHPCVKIGDDHDGQTDEETDRLELVVESHIPQDGDFYEEDWEGSKKVFNDTTSSQALDGDFDRVRVPPRPAVERGYETEEDEPVESSECLE